MTAPIAGNPLPTSQAAPAEIAGNKFAGKPGFGMNPVENILADSSIAPWSVSNGGQHPTCQIHEILNGAGIAISTVPAAPQKPLR
jgi:hypothetical protein